jgi:hypothetical protein
LDKLPNDLKQNTKEIDCKALNNQFFCLINIVNIKSSVYRQYK